jgi:tRNA pseudouridine55 synthase
VLVIDKPAGPTSHDVVARIRRVLGERRVGHTGTLDPTATGVLALVVGRATRLAKFLSSATKTYEAEIRLGISTDTHDAGGAAVGAAYRGPWPSREEISRAIELFRGELVQQPPAFSAKKVGGRRSYQIARSASRAGTGTTLTLPRAVLVTVHAIDLVAVDADRVSLRIDCSAGFYVRSLAHDLGQRLGIGGHLAALRRTRSGDFSLAQALTLEAAERDRDVARAAVIPLDRMLPGMAPVILTEEGARRAMHGRELTATDYSGAVADGGVVRLLDQAGRLLGIAQASVERRGTLHPSVVLM